jgi:co-chaperonin GroES (HSP10)
MKVRLLHERILLRRSEEAEKAKSGPVIPATAREKPLEGRINGAATETQMKQTLSASAMGS